jgi:signal transduction histidine kinase
MTSYMELRRVEQGLIKIRWFGVLFGIVAIALTPEWPDDATRILTTALVAALAAGNLVIWGAMGRLASDRSIVRLGLAAFAFDAVIIMSLVWLAAYEEPYVTWALVILVPIEGALRYRMRGALIAAVGGTLFFIPQTLRVADLRGTGFDTSTFVFVFGLLFTIAAITGTMAENWHRKNAAFLLQTLKLAEVDKLKDRFLAITSHEIRGPLTAIIAGMETVRKRGDRLTSEQRDQLFEMMSMQGDQLARLVDDLLVTSQIQSATLRLEKEWARTDAIVEQALQAAAPKRRSHMLEVFTEPCEIRIDASRLSQIVRNLVENAYKYTPEKTRVAVTAKADAGGLLLVVADEGPGIPEEKREVLFDAFSRIEETAAGQEGVGLGLYLVSQLVSAMDGEIDLSSSSKGTTFTIRIPCSSRSLRKARLGLVRDTGQASSG